jgi:peptidoglycan/LPS O-acetylase OafA/YrhL
MSRFAALDGLRGICALGVALFHLRVAFHVFDNPLVREAYVLVDFFFVLSGFVIAHAYGLRLATAPEVGSFLIRRIGRVWPLHIAVLALMVALEAIRLVMASRLGTDIRLPFSGETGPETLIPNALLVHAWGLSVLTWNVPSWSISAELLAYLLFAIVSFIARSRTLAVVAAILAVDWVASVKLAPDVEFYAQLSSLRAICGFFAGVLVHAAFTRVGPMQVTKLGGSLIEFAMAALVMGYMLFVSDERLTPWAVPVFAAAILAFASERGVISDFLKLPALQVIGTLSYSIYLTHSLVLTAFNALAKGIGRVLHLDVMVPAPTLFEGMAERGIDWDLVHFGSFWLDDLYALAFLAAVIGLSTLTYRFIEMPGQRLFAGLAKARTDLKIPA